MIWLDGSGGIGQTRAMKTLLFSCVILSCAVVASPAADPKDSSKKKAKAPEKVNARDMIAKHDTDADKKLSKEELHNALRTMKFNQFSTKNDSWKQFDTDKDEKLESKELDALLDANAAELAKVEAKAEAEAAKAAAASKGKTPPKPNNGLTLRPPGS